MKRKTRLIILLICIVLFFVIAPYIVLYSLGYRVDFLNQKITATGGIYVKTQPVGAGVSIDGATKSTTGYFYNSVFVQNLMPGQHSVSITKNGYYDYQKSLSVQENEVTKLEQVILFKKDIVFEPVVLEKNQTAKQAFALLTQKTGQINTNLSLGEDGILYQSDPNLTSKKALSLVPVKISPTTLYSLENISGSIFLHMGKSLFLFDPKTLSFGAFYNPITDLVVSPDGKKVLYYNSHELFYYVLNPSTIDISLGETGKISLATSTDGIGSAYWLNNDYIIFSEGNHVVISEIDPRGNINSITLSSKADQLFFNQQDKKAYILTGDALMVSERLVP